MENAIKHSFGNSNFAWIKWYWFFQPSITRGEPARLMAEAMNHGRPERAWFWCEEGLMSFSGPANAITWIFFNSLRVWTCGKHGLSFLELCSAPLYQCTAAQGSSMTNVFPRIDPMVSDRSVWHYGKHPRFLNRSMRQREALYFCKLLDGMLLHRRVTAALNSPVPI